MFFRSICLLLLVGGVSGALDVDEILNRSDSVMHPVNLQGSFTMTLTSRTGDTRIIKVMAYQKKRSDTREDRLFLFSFPPSVKGTGLLVHSYLDDEEDSMWIYLPAVGRTKRVNLNTSGGGYFMGSDFTFSDLISTSREELEHGLNPEEVINGDRCYVLDVRGVSREVMRKYGYSRETHYIRKSDFVLVRVIFFDMAGDLLKTLNVDEVAQIGTYRYPSTVRMENHQTGHLSVIEFDDIQTTDNLPDHYFTLRYLENQ